MSDPYKILGISRDATDEEVKKAYRQLSRKYHPDANVNNPNKDKAEEMFKLVQQAYQQVMYERQHPYSSSGYGTSGYGRPQGSPRPGGSPYSSQQSSGQTWQDENGNTYTYYGNFEDFSEFWNDFFSSFGFGTQGAYQQDNSEEAIHLRAAASYINHGMFQEALNVLDAMEERSAQWYYYSAATPSRLFPWSRTIRSTRTCSSSSSPATTGIPPDSSPTEALPLQAVSACASAPPTCA